MALPSIPYSQFSEEVSWDSLQRAIASSSGFQRWCLERDVTLMQNKEVLEQLVSRYLRETLETLAY
jgi:hypothetical protein